MLAEVAAQFVQPLLGHLLCRGVPSGPGGQGGPGLLQERHRLVVLFGHLIHQLGRAGVALAQQGEDQVLLAVVVGLQEGEDVLVVVGDQCHPLGIAGCNAPDQRGGGSEGVPEDPVHRQHVGGVGARSSAWLGHGCLLGPPPHTAWPGCDHFNTNGTPRARNPALAGRGRFIW